MTTMQAGGATAFRSTPAEVAARWRERLAFLAPLVALLVVQRLLFPAPSGVVLGGALVGGRIALIALGIALVYRANRIVNFAQGDLGGVPATLAVMLVVSSGLNYWLGFAIGLAAALVLGVLVETLIIGRFFRAPRLVLTVATIGVAQLLTGSALLLPRAFTDDFDFGTRIAPPFDTRFEVEGTIFNANDIFTMVAVPVVLLALGWFLRRSSVGIAVVAAAERADRAATLGIPVRRLHAIVWAIASALAFIAVFLRAGAVGLPIGEVLPPSFLVQALAAAVIGRFERFPTVVSAAIGIGIVDQAMVFQDGNRPAYNDAVLFVVVLVALLLMRRAGANGGRVDTDASATWQATREVRPIPRELARLPEVRAARAAIWAVLGVFVLTLPLWLSTSRLNLATIIVLFGIVAASLVVLTGWAGQVSLGHMAFVGVGAVAGGALTDRYGWDLAFAVVIAGLVGGVAAVIVGYPALRRRGLTLAVSTLAFALFIASYGLNRTIVDWLPGRRIDDPQLLTIELSNETRFFYVSLAFLGLALAMVVGVRHSRTGRALIAIRENERAARSYGVNASRTTLAAFALSGFLAALAGALFVHQQGGLAPDLYAAQRSLDLFSMVVIGGLGSLPGAVLGAVYVRGADFFLPLDWQFLATGVGLLAVLLMFPTGLGGVLADVRDAALRWVARRRGLVVPSLVADVRVEVTAEEEVALTHAADAVAEAGGTAAGEQAGGEADGPPAAVAGEPPPPNGDAPASAPPTPAPEPAPSTHEEASS
ncbi:MAG TPA: ABC transporter permease [Acidimicrobiales bacterium]